MQSVYFPNQSLPKPCNRCFALTWIKANNWYRAQYSGSYSWPIRCAHVFVAPLGDFFFGKIAIIPKPVDFFLQTRVQKLHNNVFQSGNILFLREAGKHVEHFVLCGRNGGELCHDIVGCFNGQNYTFFRKWKELIFRFHRICKAPTVKFLYTHCIETLHFYKTLFFKIAVN